MSRSLLAACASCKASSCCSLELLSQLLLLVSDMMFEGPKDEDDAAEESFVTTALRSKYLWQCLQTASAT